jgi:hypothetical protein
MIDTLAFYAKMIDTLTFRFSVVNRVGRTYACRLVGLHRIAALTLIAKGTNIVLRLTWILSAACIELCPCSSLITTKILNYGLAL